MSFKLPKPASGGDLLTWASAAWEAMRRSVPIAGPGIRISSTSSGTVISAEIRKSQAVAPRIEGPFCGVYKQADTWMLTGGIVSSSGGSVTVPDITLGDTDPVPDDGTRTWFVCTGEAVTEDGLPMPGFDLASAVPDTGAELPSPNITPTSPDFEGVIYIPLGLWSNGSFVPSGCGDIIVTHCPGSLSWHRV
jgi:hypothetical protein